MGNPTLVKMTTRNAAFTEAVVILTTNSGHDLFKASQLIFEVLQGIMENIYFGVLLSNHLAEVATLTRS